MFNKGGGGEGWEDGKWKLERKNFWQLVDYVKLYSDLI